jgi:hypothetical protein
MSYEMQYDKRPTLVVPAHTSKVTSATPRKSKGRLPPLGRSHCYNDTACVTQSSLEDAQLMAAAKYVTLEPETGFSVIQHCQHALPDILLCVWGRIRLTSLSAQAQSAQQAVVRKNLQVLHESTHTAIASSWYSTERHKGLSRLCSNICIARRCAAAYVPFAMPRRSHETNSRQACPRYHFGQAC